MSLLHQWSHPRAFSVLSLVTVLSWGFPGSSELLPVPFTCVSLYQELKILSLPARVLLSLEVALLDLAQDEPVGVHLSPSSREPEFILPLLGKLWEHRVSCRSLDRLPTWQFLSPVSHFKLLLATRLQNILPPPPPLGRILSSWGDCAIIPLGLL